MTRRDINEENIVRQGLESAASHDGAVSGQVASVTDGALEFVDAGGGSQPSAMVACGGYWAPALNNMIPVLPLAFAFDEATENYVNTQGDSSLSFLVTDHTNAAQYLKAWFSAYGEAAAIAPVPGWLQTLAAGWGANPANVWDVGGSFATIKALSGTDAGKLAYISPAPGAHPLASIVNAGPLFFTTQSGGTLALTFDGTKVFLPSEGIFTISYAPVIDFFYP